MFITQCEVFEMSSHLLVSLRIEKLPALYPNYDPLSLVKFGILKDERLSS